MNKYCKSFIQGGQTEIVSTPQELLEEATNMLSLGEKLSSMASTSTFIMQISFVYLDCVSDRNQACWHQK